MCLNVRSKEPACVLNRPGNKAYGRKEYVSDTQKSLRAENCDTRERMCCVYRPGLACGRLLFTNASEEGEAKASLMPAAGDLKQQSCWRLLLRRADNL